MPRVKRGVTANKRRKALLKKVKGYKWDRKSKYRSAKTAVYHAGNRSFNDRKNKKGDFRRAWQIQINAGSRENGISYSKLIAGLKKSDIAIDRKIMAMLAGNYPEVFKAMVSKIK